MNPDRFHTSSEDETIAFGERLASTLPSKGVVLLIGNLGAGKTTLAKGIVKGLGAASPDEVSSPTFTLIHEYSDRVYHVDLYRLDDPQAVARLGLWDVLQPCGPRLLRFDSDCLHWVTCLMYKVELVFALKVVFFQPSSCLSSSSPRILWVG